MIILDTNVVSETMRPTPADRPMKWLTECTASEVFLTAITEAEILTGIALLATGKRRAALEAAWGIMMDRLQHRILPFDSDAAREFAYIFAERRRIGRPIMQSDGQIAAIARSRGADLATRDVGHFHHCGLKVVNPWA
jgi:predicted nucleic acid-binding protein